ncbi:MAG: Na+/H+ antiporter subunit E [Bacteroidales bacterium]|nr:Na+/H+ antiporter subunit E [Bacteroidales bacterium]
MKNTSSKWSRFLYTWLLLMVVWYAFTVSFATAEIVTGLIVTGIISALNFTSFSHYGFRLFHPRRIMYLLQYSWVFLIALIKANFQVAKIVINPKLPVNPGIVKFKSSLKSDFAKMVLANSITLTPGTLTVDLIEDEFYIHWLKMTTKDEAGVYEAIAADFEKILIKIFDK